jgi:hypothetical protein
MGFPHLPGPGLFCFKIGLQPPIKGTVKAIKRIDALHRLDHTGPAPHALIVGDTINKRVFCFSRRLFFHDESPWLWVIKVLLF